MIYNVFKISRDYSGYFEAIYDTYEFLFSNIMYICSLSKTSSDYLEYYQNLSNIFQFFYIVAYIEYFQTSRNILRLAKNV